MSTHQAGGAAADDEAQQKRELEDDEEMPLAERDLADDAPWKKIQQNTFTRWCNEHLKVANKHISKLDTDLSDGLRLIALIEVLAQKKIARFNKRPTFRSMKLENVSIAIKFLEDQSIKIVNIDSSDIVDGKIKLILGLIWLLILHYSISMPMWDEEGMAEDESKKQSPKDKLLGWIQSKVPDKPIKNFNKDWNDGQAIGALVDAVAPGLCPDWQDWDPKDNLKNAKEAMKLAEDWLDVPQVLRPEDMTNKDVDDLSMMTYLSAFPKAKLKPGAPLRPKSNAKKVADKVRAYGPGLEDGNAISKPTEFTVETFGAGSGKVDIVIMDPKGKPLEHHMKANKDKKQTYTVEYTPKLAGKHVITIKFKDVEIPKSPFTVNVANITTDASKCSAKGPGLEATGLVLNQKTYFEIFTAGAGAANPTVTMTAPDGKQVPVKLQDKGKGVYYVEYTPIMVGVYKIEIKFGGAHIPGSVFNVKIAHALNAGKAFAYGRGLQPKGLRVKEECIFYIDTKEAGEAELKVQIIGPGGVDEPVKTTYNNDGLYTCKYSPYKAGRYIVNVKYGGQAIPKAPFTVNIGPEPTGPLTQVRAFGPGLEGGIVGKSCDFTVETNGAVGALGFAIEGPSQAEIKCKDNGDGSCEVSYFPTSPGDYAVHVTYEEEDIPCSPFMAKVVPNPGGFDASKVKAFGPGLAADGLEIKKKTEFTVDVKQAGTAKLVIDIRDQWGNKIEAEVKDNKNGTYTVYYTPEHPLKHTVAVTWGGVSIPNSPFKINVGGGMTKVKVYGPGVEPNKVKAKQPTEFTIDTKEAGKAPVAVTIKSKAGVNGPKEKEIPVKVKDNNDGTFTANYTPEGPGEYAVSVKYGGTELPQSPIKVGVVPDVDVGKIKITDLQEKVFCECPTDFKVDAKPLGQPLDKNLLTTDITTPSKKKIKPTITDNKDNTYTVGYVPVEQGPHTVDVAFAGQPLGNSPYTADAYPGFDASKVKAYGPGLEAGLTNKPAQFTVETKNAGKGGLGIQVEGPAETKMTCKDNKDGTCAVEYFPKVPGDYAVHVTFADEPIPGSPFRPTVCDSVDASKVKATGPGLDRNGVRANVPAEFKVDAKQAGKAPLDVTVIQEKGAPEKAKIVDNKDGTYDVTYVPKTEGRCQVDIKYGGQTIPESPFNTKVLPKSDATKVKVDGPGIQKTGVLASLPVEFTVDTRDAGDAELIISITDSKGKPVKPDIRDNGDGTFTISYVPKDVGQYTVTVTYGGKNVPASPFSIKTSPTGDASKCSIMGCKSGNYEIPVRRKSLNSESTTTTRTTTTRTTTTKETITKTVIVEEETVIKVNSRDAGKGHVTCTITGPDGKEIPDVKVIQNPDGTFDIIWTCPAAGNYEVDLRFGGVSLTGGPITIYAAPGPPEDLIKPDNVQQVEAAMPQDCRPLDLVIPVIGAGSGCITGEVKTPSGRVDTPVILENKDGTITVKYSPRETGQHLLAIKYNGKDVPGSPFHFHVDELKSGNVTAYGTGLTHGISNEPCHFIINTKDAGAGGLSLAIEGPSKAEIKCVDNKDGTCSVTYFPTKPGQYDIVVKFADKHIPGSPFSAQIVDKAGSRMSIGTPSDVPLKITETDLTQLTATILTPSKQEEKCSLKRLPNGNIGITFTPKEIGEHLVSVKKKGNHIPNSPFKIIVGSQEVGDATKVKVTGRGIKECEAGQTAQFVVDTRNAGYGGLGVSIEGPSKADINCEDKGDGTCLVTYKPTEPGTYNVNVHYADQLVPGSPFQVTVKGESSELPLIRETLVRPTQATPVSHIGSECELSVKIPGTDPLDMTAQVTNPAGRTEDAEIIDKPDCKYCVKFVPTMDGVHTVSVKNRGMHVPGSPFQFTVGPFGEGGAHKVHAGGPGLERGEVGQKAEFTVWTREAGPGKLGITVSGPAKAPINFTDNKDGSYLVSYVPTMPGDYVVDIKFNDKPIPDSPYKPFITPPMGEARRLSVASLQETGVKANQPCSFVIQLNGAKGHLKARAVSPSGTDVDCIITEIDEENYAVRFLPKENGIHLVHVFFKDTPIPGSPFRIRVGTVEEVGDPGMVHAYGDGLEKGKTGETCEFIVNTCGAGAGTLAIQIDGPSKVKLDVTEVAEGYKCHYVATHPGEYMISIKYGGPINITGSPFKAKITGAAKGAAKAGVQESAQVMVETIVKTTTTTGFQAPVFTSDATKVVSSGMGLKKAFINKKSQFTVNGNDAGNNMLVVGIAGPKTPCEEILVKHNYGQRYTVTYLLKEKGNYVLMVKWGEEHIPGSPFSIQCA